MNIYLDTIRRDRKTVVCKNLSFLVGLAAMVVSGCAVNNVTPEDDPVTQKLDSFVVEEGAIKHTVDDQEVAKLWQESEILRRSGDTTNARNRLQQAIEITPADPVLWSRAAELELDQKSHLRAENYAAKSNFLSPVGNTSLRYRNWLIIQRSREGRGDLLGAREAEIESTRLIK